MKNTIVNKQIPISSIIDVANYLEKYKEDYLKKFHDDELKNKNIPIKEQRWSYDYSSSKSIYKDDIDEYVKHSEIHIGQFWDAAQRRNKIEKIYKITNKIILVQLLISIVLFFVL